MNNNRITEEIMDLRDTRIRMQYKAIALQDKQFWEPNNFTEDDAYMLRFYRAEIARIKATEEELRDRMHK